jgi:biopolymer transport protein ExbB
MIIEFDIVYAITSLINAGGFVIWVILAVSIVLWSLLFERYLFFWIDYPKLKNTILNQWQKRIDKNTWHSEKIRELLIAEANLNLNKSMLLIKSLIGLCPMLGLIGTVTGMIHVFDVMTYLDGNNARAMASGISMATIPTMAGMVIAISGIYFNVRLSSRIRYEIHSLSDQLTID